MRKVYKDLLSPEEKESWLQLFLLQDKGVISITDESEKQITQMGHSEAHTVYGSFSD